MWDFVNLFIYSFLSLLFVFFVIWTRKLFFWECLILVGVLRLACWVLVKLNILVSVVNTILFMPVYLFLMLFASRICRCYLQLFAVYYFRLTSEDDPYLGGCEFICVIAMCCFVALVTKRWYIYIYIYILIDCHPQTDCFVASQLFSVARHVGRLKLGSKPAQLQVRLSIRPLCQQANHVS